AENEAAGAQANQSRSYCGSVSQVPGDLLRNWRCVMQETANDDDVVESRGRDEAGGRFHTDAAARGYRAAMCAHDVPLAADRPTSVALVGRQAQHVDERREGGEREIVGEKYPHAQPHAGTLRPAGGGGWPCSRG